MAVTPNPFDTRLRLIFYVGDDEMGNPMYKSKTFNKVKPEASDQALYDVAQALASLQINTLVETERTDRATLVDL